MSLTNSSLQADSTRTSNIAFRVGRRLFTAPAVTIILLLGGGAAIAHADGDPASDVLASQSLYLPQDAGVPVNQGAQLSALLSAAGRRGYPIRLALIASPADLGSVGELWHQPQSYAQFLGQELSLVYRGSLLVVMPDGFGLYRAGGRLSATTSALAGASPPGSELAGAAMSAIQRLATASGRALPARSGTVVSTSGATDTVAWIVFALGGALIILAWTASLRARPPRLRGAR